jgi:hypothetical protein
MPEGAENYNPPCNKIIFALTAIQTPHLLNTNQNRYLASKLAEYLPL